MSVTIGDREFNVPKGNTYIEVTMHPQDAEEAREAIEAVLDYADDFHPRWEGSGSSVWANQVVRIGDTDVKFTIFLPREITSADASPAVSRAREFAQSVLEAH